MKNKPIKLLGLTLACVMVFTSAVALADENTQTRRQGKGIGIASQTGIKLNEMTTEQRLANLKAKLDEQVTAGTITQEKADEIYAKAESGDFSGMRFGKDGKNFQRPELTDEQKTEMKANMLSKLKERLDEQVTAGKITQEEADAKYAEAEACDLSQMKMGKGSPMKELTDEQKAEMKANMLSKLKERLDEQVAAGTITQEEADAKYAQAEACDLSQMKMGKGSPMKELTDEQKAEIKANMLSKLKERLDEQVTAGTITQEEADAKYAQAESSDFPQMRMGQKNKEFKELTDEQKTEIKANALAKLKENLDKQVSEGTITQEKADEIYSKAESGNFNFMGEKMHRGGRSGNRNNIEKGTTTSDA